MKIKRSIAAVGWFLSVAILASAFGGRVTTANADSYENFVSYVRDYHSQKAYRSTKVTHGGWTYSFGWWAFHTWTVEAYANIMLTDYQYHWSVHRRESDEWGSDPLYWEWDLSYGNTPSYIPRSYYDSIDSDAAIKLLTGTSKNENTLLSPFDTAWSEVTAPWHTSSLYGSGSGLSTTYP